MNQVASEHAELSVLMHNCLSLQMTNVTESL